MRKSIGLVAGLLSIGLGSALAAQQLHGTVRDSASGQPIPAAVLMLLDGAGTILGRNITNERGEFLIALSSEMRRVRVVRIGFRPREAAIPALVEGRAELPILMRALPAFLEPVHVVAGAQCPRRSDEVRTFALLEQARAGLLAIVVAREANPAALVRLMFERNMEGDGDRIAHQTVTIDSTPRAAISFNAARTATDFIQRGFMADSARQHIFYAADADVLLDPGFAAGYCFRIVDAGRDRPNQIGLGFSAADRRRGRIDIDGVLWVDTVARALRGVEHRFVGLDHQVETLRPGGYVSFREMPNGVMMIDRWSLRLIGGTPDTVRTPAFVTGRRVEAPVAQVRLILYASENGGEVARATWPDGRSWHASLGTLRVHATMSDRRPAAGAAVHLVETQYRAVADSNGDIEIADLIPGPYALAIRDPRLVPLGLEIETPISFVAERDSTSRQSLVVNTTEEFVVARCVAHHRYTPGDSVFVLGRALTPDGKPVSGLVVALEQKIGQVTKPLSESVKTGADGLFQFCGRGLKPGMTIGIEAWRDGDAVSAGSFELANNLAIVKLSVTSP
jgi:hypothetical protein